MLYLLFFVAIILAVIAWIYRHPPTVDAHVAALKRAHTGLVKHAAAKSEEADALTESATQAYGEASRATRISSKLGDLIA